MLQKLSWQDEARFEALSAAWRAHFEDDAQFAAWRQAIRTGMFIGRFVCWVTDAAGLLLERHDRCLTILATDGAWDGEALREVFTRLMDEAEVIMFDPAIAPDWLPQLEPLGFRGFERRTFVQAVQRAYLQPMPPTHLSLTPWEPRFTAPVAALLAEANAGTLDGLFLTMPLLPTPAACEQTLTRLLEGGEGQFLPWASVVALDGEKLVGVLLAVETGDRQATLFEIAITPEARGQNLSRRLVQAYQRAIIARGYTELQFLTTSENPQVHRLFLPEEIIRQETNRGAYWLRARESSAAASAEAASTPPPSA